MKKKFDRTRTLFVLAVLLFVFIILSYLSYESKTDWQKELGKSFLTLALTVIIGGLIKLIFDQIQDQKKKDEAQKEKEARNNEKLLLYKEEMLQRLRKVFDGVDSSRILLEAHKSAKTYGEKIREFIIPSIVTLYDIKRSIIHESTTLGQDRVIYLRVSLHYMIAYLKVLAEEYKLYYLHNSNIQFYQEAFKEKVKNIFVSLFEKRNESSLQSVNDIRNIRELIAKEEQNIPIPIDFAWNSIKQLKFLKDYLSDSNQALYYSIFIDHYEYCKRLLKSDFPIDEIKRPGSFENKYVQFLLQIDSKKEGGKMESTDNLVTTVLKEKLGFEKIIYEEGNDNPKPLLEEQNMPSITTN